MVCRYAAKLRRDDVLRRTAHHTHQPAAASRRDQQCEIPAGFHRLHEYGSRKHRSRKYLQQYVLRRSEAQESHRDNDRRGQPCTLYDMPGRGDALRMVGRRCSSIRPAQPARPQRRQPATDDHQRAGHDLGHSASDASRRRLRPPHGRDEGAGRREINNVHSILIAQWKQAHTR